MTGTRFVVALLATCMLLLSSTARADDGTPDVVYVASPDDIVDKMLRMAEVKKDDLLYDLGCGDGRIVVRAAKKYGCQTRGYDINPERVRESIENIKKNGVGELAKVERRNVFELDLSPASVITLYLLPEMNVRLIPQLEKLKPGSRIVAHDYGIEGIESEESITVNSKEDGVEHYLYLYTTPLKKEAVEDELGSSEE